VRLFKLELPERADAAIRFAPALTLPNKAARPPDFLACFTASTWQGKSQHMQ
jgi:hypothetical protein